MQHTAPSIPTAPQSPPHRHSPPQPAPEPSQRSHTTDGARREGRGLGGCRSQDWGHSLLCHGPHPGEGGLRLGVRDVGMILGYLGMAAGTPCGGGGDSPRGGMPGHPAVAVRAPWEVAGVMGTPRRGQVPCWCQEPPDAGLRASPGGRSATAAPLLPDRLKLDSCRSLMPPCRVAGRVGVSARGVPVSFFPACTTTATSPRYGVRSTPRSFKLCREREKERREHQQPRGGGPAAPAGCGVPGPCSGVRIGRAGAGKGQGHAGAGEGAATGEGALGEKLGGLGVLPVQSSARAGAGAGAGGWPWQSSPSPRPPGQAKPSRAKQIQAKPSKAEPMRCPVPSPRHTELPTSAPVLPSSACDSGGAPGCPLPLQHQHHAVP